MTRSKPKTYKAFASSLALATVALPTLSALPAAYAQEPTLAVAPASQVLHPATQTTPFIQQTITTEIKLPASFSSQWNLRNNLDGWESSSENTLSYSRTNPLAYQSGVLDGSAVASYESKDQSSYAEIIVPSYGVRVADGNLTHMLVVSVGDMHDHFDITVPFQPTGSVTVDFPQEIIDSAKDNGLDLNGASITLSTAVEEFGEEQTIFPALCWTPTAAFAENIDLSRSLGVARVGNTFVIPAGVTVSRGVGYLEAKLPATIAFKGAYQGVVLSPQIKIQDSFGGTVIATLRGYAGLYDPATQTTKHNDFSQDLFGTVAHTIDWNLSGSPANETAFTGALTLVYGSPFIGVYQDDDLGNFEAGCINHEAELAEAHVQLFKTAADRTVLFSDVSEETAFSEEILWASRKEFLRGFEDGTFRPQEDISRAAMAALIYRMAGSPSYQAPESSPFVDLPTDHPFYHEIAWLADQGITTGYPDGTFRPAEPVSRAATAAFLYRFAGKPYFSTPVSPFEDLDLDHPFLQEIAWLSAAEVTLGWEDGTFRPADPISRAAMAAFIYRFNTRVHPL